MWKTLMLTTACAVTLGLSGAAFAQAQSDISNQQLQQFASVQQQLMQVQQKHRQAFQQAGSQEEKMAIQQQAGREMTNIVEGSPLSIEQYNQIGTALQTSEVLQKRLTGMMTQQQQ